MTQEEFSEKLSVTFQAVSKWENAKTAPDVLLLPFMADILECSIDNLVSYIPKSKQEIMNVLPGHSVPAGMKQYFSEQIRWQFDHDGSTDLFLEAMADNLWRNFELTDENIERLLDAYREMYKGMRKKEQQG